MTSAVYLPEQIQAVVKQIFQDAGVNITFDYTQPGDITVETNVNITNPDALGRDPGLGPRVQLDNAKIGHAAITAAAGSAQGALTIAYHVTGVVLSHEMGHYLLQQGHPEVGSVGIMRPGNEQVPQAYYMDMTGQQRFTREQKIKIRTRCNTINKNKARRGGGRGSQDDSNDFDAVDCSFSPIIPGLAGGTCSDGSIWIGGPGGFGPIAGGCSLNDITCNPSAGGTPKHKPLLP